MGVLMNSPVLFLLTHFSLDQLSAGSHSYFLGRYQELKAQQIGFEMHFAYL